MGRYGKISNIYTAEKKTQFRTAYVIWYLFLCKKEKNRNPSMYLLVLGGTI